MKNEVSVKSLRGEYGKGELTLKELCKEIGISYSKATKYFGGSKSYTDKYILEHKLLPRWEQNKGEQRRWKLTEVVKWLYTTESENE